MWLLAALGEERVAVNRTSNDLCEQGMEGGHGETRSAGSGEPQGCHVQIDHGHVDQGSCRAEQVPHSVTGFGAGEASHKSLLEQVAEVLLHGVADIYGDNAGGPVGTNHERARVCQIDGRDVFTCESGRNRAIEDTETIAEVESAHHLARAPCTEPNLTIRQEALGDSTSTHEPFLLEALGRLAESRERQDAPVGGPDPPPVVPQLNVGRDERPDLRLLNPHGVSCYLNALAYALWWLWIHHALSFPPLPQALQDALLYLQQSGGLVLDLGRIPCWTTLLGDWIFGTTRRCS